VANRWAGYRSDPYVAGWADAPPGMAEHALSGRPGQRRAWPALLGLLVLAAGAAVLVQLKPDGADAYPKHWDRRVVAAVHFVEHDRGLAFKHPIKVEFLSVAAFTRRVTPPSSADDGVWGAQDGLDADLEAIGLVPSDVDFSQARRQINSSIVLGFYDYDTQHIVVRGSSLSPAANVTLVHELTHALQDQYYDIGRRGRLLAPRTANARPSALRDGFLAVVEGDARDVEYDYLRSRSAAERAAIAREDDADRKQAVAGTKDVPQTLIALDEVPYELGRGLVAYQRQAGGAQAERQLFRRWPSSEMQILQPWRYVDGDVPVPVDLPDPPDGVEPFDSGTLGAVDWYLMLAERLGPARALAAADAWAGDAFVAYRVNEEPCVRADLRATTPAALAGLHRALDAWARTVPALRPRITAAGDTVRLQSCAPQTGSVTVPDRTGPALAYATERSDLATALLRDGTPERAAACVATRLLRKVPVSALVAAQASPRTKRIARQARAACT